MAVIAGSVGWVARDQAARRAATARVVTTALEESASWQAQRRMPEALTAARRANGLLDGADGDEALGQRARVRLADLELLERLENIRLEKMTEAKDGGFNVKGADDLYRQTFRGAGLDVEALPVTEAGQRIRRSTVATEVAAMLDQWASLRRYVKGAEDSSWRHLLRVARQADPDVWRTRLRESLERRDRKALRAAAEEEEVFRLSVATLLVLGDALLEEKAPDGTTPREALDLAETFLRKAQRRHPNDFWLNYQLYVVVGATSPPQREKAIRFATAAVALRPESSRAHMNLGPALLTKGQMDEAIAEFREAVRHKKDYAQAYSCLGDALGVKGRLDEAIAAYKEAIRLKQDFFEPHRNLVSSLHAKGRLDKAITAYREAIRLTKDDAWAHQHFSNCLIVIGNAFRDKGRLDDAIDAYQEAIRLKADFAEAHSNLGNALAGKGDMDGAIAVYRGAIRLRKDLPAVHCNLGHALSGKGQFAEALTHLRRGHELGAKNLRWDHPSA